MKNEEGTFILRVKRKKCEKPSETLILQTVDMPDHKKRLRIVPPENYIESRFGALKLGENEGEKKEKNWNIPKHLLFHLVKDLPIPATQEVKVSVEGEDCSLFKIDPKGKSALKNAHSSYQKEKKKSKKETSIPDRDVWKERLLEEQEKMRKQKVLNLIANKRKNALEMHDKSISNHIFLVALHEKVEELKKKDEAENDILLYCNEKALNEE